MMTLAGTLILLATIGAADETLPEERSTERRVAQAPAERARELVEDSDFLDDFETIVVTSRKRRTHDADTQLRLDRETLIQRGVTSVTDALAQLPEVAIHENRRGGIVADIRGARQRQFLVMIDGVPADEPWRGLFDLSSIPITDVEEIRIRTAPATPLDGLGGSAGIIEVVTRPAAGALEAVAQSYVTTAPAGRLSVTGKGSVSERVAVRVSGGGFADRNEMEFGGPDSGRLGEDRNEGFASMRLTLEGRAGRLFADAFALRRAFMIPPDDDTTLPVGVFERIDREDTVRTVLGGDTEIGALRLAARGYAQFLDRETSRYLDPSLTQFASTEAVSAERAGSNLELSWSRSGWQLAARAALETEYAEIDSTNRVDLQGGRSSIGQLAGGIAYMTDRFEVSGTAGAASPINAEDDPWFEGSLETKLRPYEPWEVTLIVARKGRLPNLRERFDFRGNPDAPPEITNFAEIKNTVRYGNFEFKSSAYFKRIDSLLSLGEGADLSVNGADIDILGLESAVTFNPDGAWSVGTAHNLMDGSPDTEDGFEPLSFMPRHRIDLFAQGHFDDQFGGWGRVRYTTEREDQGVLLDDFFIVEASGWWRVNETLRAVVRVDNATNTSYLSRANLRADGTTLTVLLEGR
ncbi:MAG: TonB-dependent receptor plug domain-containing protein, partial [Myxococcota bacterium]